MIQPNVQNSQIFSMVEGLTTRDQAAQPHQVCKHCGHGHIIPDLAYNVFVFLGCVQGTRKINGSLLLMLHHRRIKH